MDNLYNNIIDIRDNFDVFLLDANGVFWNGRDFYDGVKDVMERLVKEGKIVYILSNSTKLLSDLEKLFAKNVLEKGFTLIRL